MQLYCSFENKNDFLLDPGESVVTFVRNFSACNSQYFPVIALPSRNSEQKPKTFGVSLRNHRKRFFP